MNDEFLYNLSLAAGLFVGLMIMILRFRAADRFGRWGMGGKSRKRFAT